jgi:tetratricopeptide (TPR) repeat protein
MVLEIERSFFGISWKNMKIFLVLLAAALTFIVCQDQTQAQTPTELAQGVRELSPLDYYALSQKARGYFKAGDYAAAVNAYEQLTKSYPFNGDSWYWLGRAQYSNKQFKNAGNSFKKAFELGTGVEARNGSAFSAALAFANANEPETALDWIERYFSNNSSQVDYSLLQNKAFDNLRQNPRFQKWDAPVVGNNVSREEGWKIDLDYLLAQFRRFNPQYNQPRIKEKIDAAANRLREQIPRLNDIQIAVEMQKITAMLEASHTEVFLHRQPRRFKFPEPLPVNLYIFPDGIYVVEADDEFKSLVGSRVTAIDGTPIEQAIEKLRPLVSSEGEPTRLIMTRFLILPHVLHSVGVARQADRVSLSIVDRENKARTIEISSKPNHQWRNNLLPLTAAEAGAPTPLYMTRADNLYWFEPLPKDKAVYVRLISMRDKPDETIAAFGLRLRQFLDKQPDIRNFIMDLRGNAGGNSFLYPELLRTIVGFDSQQGKQVFVLIDRAVLSAGTNFSVDLDRLTNATFIGEPTGGQPRQNGDPINFYLPYSGMLVILSTVSWNLSGPYDTRLWIAPDVPVALTSRDYFTNRDSVMDAVYNLIRKDN